MWYRALVFGEYFQFWIVVDFQLHTPPAYRRHPSQEGTYTPCLDTASAPLVTHLLTSHTPPAYRRHPSQEGNDSHFFPVGHVIELQIYPVDFA